MEEEHLWLQGGVAGPVRHLGLFHGLVIGVVHSLVLRVISIIGRVVIWGGWYIGGAPGVSGEAYCRFWNVPEDD